MSPGLHDESDEATQASASERTAVRRELERLHDFFTGLTPAEVRDGTWLAKLLTHALQTYSKRVDAAYLRSKYPGLPPDAVVGARISLAARYAGLEGGLSAGAYTAAVAATLGSAGGASPVALPAAAVSFLADLGYCTQLQLRLAYDIAVLYGVPLDLDDPEDLWKLIRVAFVVKSGEAGRTAVSKGIPVFLRPMIKRFYSGSTLAAAKSLPVVGKHLLQRNVIKFSLPVVGVPASAAVNYWSTRSAGAYARNQFRLEGRIVEAARRLTAATTHHDVLLWVLWMVVKADALVHENERALLRHVAREVADLGAELAALAELERTVEVDQKRVWSLLETATGDRTGIYEAAVVAAAVDGKANVNELRLLDRLAPVCGATYDERAVRDLAADWAANR